jgi:hypothetical protein
MRKLMTAKTKKTVITICPSSKEKLALFEATISIEAKAKIKKSNESRNIKFSCYFKHTSEHCKNKPSSSCLDQF